MSLHMNESALWPTIKELLNNHITDSNETGRLKSWAKVYEADRKSLWKPLSSQVSGHILYVQRRNECGGSSCYSEKIWWQEGPLKHLCTLMKRKKGKKPESTQNDGLLAMKPGHAAIGEQPMQLWRGPLQLHIHFPGLRQKTHSDWLWQWRNFYHFPTKHHRGGFELNTKNDLFFQGLQVNNLINRFVVSNAWKKTSLSINNGDVWSSLAPFYHPPFLPCRHVEATWVVFLASHMSSFWTHDHLGPFWFWSIFPFAPSLFPRCSSAFFIRCLISKLAVFLLLPGALFSHECVFVRDETVTGIERFLFNSRVFIFHRWKPSVSVCVCVCSLNRWTRWQLFDSIKKRIHKVRVKPVKQQKDMLE